MSWSTTRERDCRRASAWSDRTGSACKSCARWWRPNSVALSVCTRGRGVAPTQCCGSPWVAVPRGTEPRQLSDGGAGASARGAALEGAALVLAHATPHARILTGLEGPGQAFGGDGAAGAHHLGIGNLREGRTTVAHGEEQLRILVATDCLVAPVHTSTP